MNNNKIAIILDWDDTLFPTYFYSIKNIKYTFHLFKNKFELLERSIINMLIKLNKYKNVYILTNGSMKWFYSSVKYIPKIIPYLKDIKIISARDHFSKLYPNDIVLWKTFSILNILNHNMFLEKILFVSDLDIDFKSLKKVKMMKPYIETKTYKFMETPMICQLIKQQNDLTRFIDFILVFTGINDYNFYKKKI